MVMANIINLTTNVIILLSTVTNVIIVGVLFVALGHMPDVNTRQLEVI